MLQEKLYYIVTMKKEIRTQKCRLTLNVCSMLYAVCRDFVYHSNIFITNSEYFIRAFLCRAVCSSVVLRFICFRLI